MSADTRTALVAIRRVLDCFAVDELPDHLPAQQNVSPIRVGDIRKAREAADHLAAKVGEKELAEAWWRGRRSANERLGEWACPELRARCAKDIADLTGKGA